MAVEQCCTRYSHSRRAGIRQRSKRGGFHPKHAPGLWISASQRSCGWNTGTRVCCHCGGHTRSNQVEVNDRIVFCLQGSGPWLWTCHRTCNRALQDRPAGRFHVPGATTAPPNVVSLTVNNDAVLYAATAIRCCDRVRAQLAGPHREPAT